MANNFPTIKPSLNLQLARTGILPPDVTFTRASSSGGYYDGKTVVKAEENLFTNSVWAGAVTGTPGTVPTGWAFVTSGGTLTASGESIEFFAAAGQRQSISQILTVTAGQVITVSVDVDSVVGTATAALVQLEPLSGSYTSTTNVVVSGGTGRKSASTTCTVGGILRIRFGASVTSATADDFTVSMKSPQIEIRSFATAYTPTTTQPITRFQPKLEYAIANEPVFDHNPVTGEALGLSIFEARTNLLLRSEEFDNAFWSKENATVSANQIIAPDGTLTADKLAEDTATGLHRVTRIITVSAGFRTGAVYLKAAERFVGELFVQDSGSIKINLLTGAVLGTQGTTTVTDVGNGWWRVTIAQTTTFTTPQVRIAIGDDSGATTYTGDGTSGIYIWGAQLETGAFATPYIPTVGSTVTRSADAAVMTGANFSRFYRADEGSFVMEAVSLATGSTSVSCQVDNGSSNNRLIMAARPSGATQSYATGIAGGVTQFEFNGTHLASNKSGFSYKLNDCAGSLNSGAISTDSVAILPAVSVLRIGGGVGGPTSGGNIKSLQYYPARLTNAQLQAVTA